MRTGLAWPYNLARYEAQCPEGHTVELFTGYNVFAPSTWQQVGNCGTCKRAVQRTVGMRGMEFVSGPIHWYGESTQAEQEWQHDVLSAHECPRCRQLGAREVARAIRQIIAAKRKSGGATTCAFAILSALATMTGEDGDD
ncbi:hypothetical protein A2V54_01325 [candidate division WWE3 bacterium RBG_19FT_COMBO_53_11]|uniref:Uncharacterized protein n=1 Tax=candidate division WWE3 bacterium RBG_19FT_COMBO_53_11 TaxID=1802613 RepID=A0A1F4UJ29_UNCKA|nr:MAG: hypothetical protein A2155_01410 [candidate division WWE3 bacterium RBG_16_52_45]OGC44919.1 MAG: hypothetical protein A2V54_01325 [candidate division WWE3 bacterium RBG_19FT_COMBO_53_11]